MDNKEQRNIFSNNSEHADKTTPIFRKNINTRRVYIPKSGLNTSNVKLWSYMTLHEIPVMLLPVEIYSKTFPLYYDQQCDFGHRYLNLINFDIVFQTYT